LCLGSLAYNLRQLQTTPQHDLVSCIRLTWKPHESQMSSSMSRSRSRSKSLTSQDGKDVFKRFTALPPVWTGATKVNLWFVGGMSFVTFSIG
jgi:hypothetical protein